MKAEYPQGAYHGPVIKRTIPYADVGHNLWSSDHFKNTELGEFNLYLSCVYIDRLMPINIILFSKYEKVGEKCFCLICMYQVSN